MALMMGPLRPDHTYGEQQVFDTLRRHLPDEYQVWPELAVQGQAERQHPDFVLLHPLWGIIVLEVKDYRRIVSANPSRIVFRPKNGPETSEKNPVDQAKGYADTIADMIRDTHRRARAEDAYHGPPPKVCRAYGVVLTWQTGADINQLERLLKARHYLLGKEDLVAYAFEDCLKKLPRPGGVERLDEECIELVRRALFPEGEMRGEAGDYLGFMDPEQERLTKEGIYPGTNGDEPEADTGADPEGSASEQLTLLDQEEPSLVQPDVDKLELGEKGEDLVPRFNIRLVRGVAGSGKTQILCKRAALLGKINPEWDILVLTRNRGLAADLGTILRDFDSITVTNFERMCHSMLGDPGVDLWRPPIPDSNQPHWIAASCQDVAGIEDFDTRFLREEFNWMKYVGRTGRESYIAGDRDGREIPLDRRTQRPVVHQAFEAYEKRLSRFRQMVWPDVPLLMLDAMDDGLVAGELYDAILVDEAQMFPPTWFEVVTRWLKRPHGMLFLAADMTQNIYGRFSWKQKHVEVRGRARVLRRSYRNSDAIARAAYHLVSSDDDLTALLKKDGDELVEPELDPANPRPGRLPRLVHCGSLDAEFTYITDELKARLEDPDSPIWPSEIAVLCLKERTQQDLASHLRHRGVPVVLVSEERKSREGSRVLVGLVAGITGQEFKSVFVCDLQELFDRDSTYNGGSWPEFKAAQLRLLYTAMTRARTGLHLCHRRNLNSALNPLGEVTEAVRV